MYLHGDKQPLTDKVHYPLPGAGRTHRLTHYPRHCTRVGAYEEVNCMGVKLAWAVLILLTYVLYKALTWLFDWLDTRLFPEGGE